MPGTTAQDIHDACYQAMCSCPQFQGFDDDEPFDGWCDFGKIPSKGIAYTVRFWRDSGYASLLWDGGYADELPEHIRTLFDEIDRVIDAAIAAYCKTL